MDAVDLVLPRMGHGFFASLQYVGSVLRERSEQGARPDQEDAGIPWLSEIPWLGKLFTQQRETSAKSELVILLRPVVASDEQWQHDISGSRERVQRYTGETP